LLVLIWITCKNFRSRSIWNHREVCIM